MLYSAPPTNEETTPLNINDVYTVVIPSILSNILFDLYSINSTAKLKNSTFSTITQFCNKCLVLEFNLCFDNCNSIQYFHNTI